MGRIWIQRVQNRLQTNIFQCAYWLLPLFEFQRSACCLLEFRLQV